MIRWRVGDRRLPADAFAKRFHRPELVTKALREEPVPQDAGRNVSRLREKGYEDDQ